MSFPLTTGLLSVFCLFVFKGRTVTMSECCCFFLPESFQDWENEVRLGNCDEDMLIYMIRLDCGEKFSKSMSAVSKEKWCVLEEIIRCVLDWF